MNLLRRLLSLFEPQSTLAASEALGEDWNQRFCPRRCTSLMARPPSLLTCSKRTATLNWRHYSEEMRDAVWDLGATRIHRT